jgi:very-short-patch-repair endonuclease
LPWPPGRMAASSSPSPERGGGPCEAWWWEPALIERPARLITGPNSTLVRARKLRREMTTPERMLWLRMRGRPSGLKFRRQHPAGVYVLDFYCAAARLAIEIDGWAHDSAVTRERDASRSQYLRSQGVATLRVPAIKVLDDADTALARIVEVCLQRVAARS